MSAWLSLAIEFTGGAPAVAVVAGTVAVAVLERWRSPQFAGCGRCVGDQGPGCSSGRVRESAVSGVPGTLVRGWVGDLLVGVGWVGGAGGGGGWVAVVGVWVAKWQRSVALGAGGEAPGGRLGTAAPALQGGWGDG